MEQQAYSVFITSSYSYIPYLYSEQHYQKVALAENAISLRYILGPIIESIYMQQVPFITFIILSIFYGYQVHYSKFQNNKKECEIDMIEINFHSQHSEPQLEQPQSYFKVLKQYNVYINALIFAMVTTSIISIFHQWHNICKITIKLKNLQVGFYIELQPMCYTIATILITRIQNTNKPLFMIRFQLLNGIPLFFMVLIIHLLVLIEIYLFVVSVQPQMEFHNHFCINQNILYNLYIYFSLIR